jgi:hypothetical protein
MFRSLETFKDGAYDMKRYISCRSSGYLRVEFSYTSRVRDTEMAYGVSVQHLDVFTGQAKPGQLAPDGDMTEVGRCRRQSSSNLTCLRAMLLAVDLRGREEDSVNLERVLGARLKYGSCRPECVRCLSAPRPAPVTFHTDYRPPSRRSRYCCDWRLTLHVLVRECEVRVTCSPRNRQ